MSKIRKMKYIRSGNLFNCEHRFWYFIFDFLIVEASLGYIPIGPIPNLQMTTSNWRCEMWCGVWRGRVGLKGIGKWLLNAVAETRTRTRWEKFKLRNDEGW